MAIQSLHEMIRNLSAYIKSLEVLCECGVTLSKNFERLLSQHTGGGSNVAGASSSTSGTLDSDMLSQSVATWELAHKVAHADATSLIDELLPLLQDTIHGVMKDPAVIQSSATYEVFRSCFSAFFQIQWRFCQLYLSCASSQAGSHGGGPLRSPETHLARSPTLASFTSSSMSGDRRESTESCMSAFSLPRSSFSGMSSISSRSSSPSPGMGHYHGHGGHYGFGGRSRTSSIFESSASVKFTPSQPPSPLMPYGGEGGFQPNLFRRWSAYSNVSAGTAGSGHSSGGGSGVGSSISGMGSYGSSGGNGASLLSSPMSYGYAGYQAAGGFSRRWSVPASSSISQHSSGGESSKKSESPDLDYGLINAINLLSTKPPTPTNLITTLEESHGEYGELESEEPQTTALWPPSDTMPGII